MKIYKNNARWRLLCRMAKRSIGHGDIKIKKVCKDGGIVTSFRHLITDFIST